MEPYDNGTGPAGGDSHPVGCFAGLPRFVSLCHDLRPSVWPLHTKWTEPTRLTLSYGE